MAFIDESNFAVAQRETVLHMSNAALSSGRKHTGLCLFSMQLNTAVHVEFAHRMLSLVRHAGKLVVVITLRGDVFQRVRGGIRRPHPSPNLRSSDCPLMLAIVPSIPVKSVLTYPRAPATS